MSATVRAALLTATLASASGMTATEALAQGFFQNLFGGGGTSSPAPVIRPMSPSPHDYRYRQPAAPPPRPVGSDDHPVEKGGRYRTMCVRMCDGYYYPISASVSRREFYRDARICKKSCGTDAVLFYHSSSSGDASTMIDLTGRAYARLPNALRYRKQLVDGCTCRPEPWSVSEIARHHRYAMEASREAAESRNSGGPETAEPPTQVAKAPLAAAGRALNDGAEPTTASPVPLALTITPIANDADKEHSEASATEPSALPVIGRSAKAPAKPSPSRRASELPAQAKTRSRPTATRSVAKPPQPAPFGLGLGNQKLRWPGD